MARKSTLKNAGLRLSIPEIMASMRVDDRTDQGTWRQLRGLIWLSYVMLRSQWTLEELKDALDEHRTRSNLVENWLNGSRSPYPLSARKLKRKVPGSLELFSLPLWLLLRNSPRSVKYCQKAMSAHIRAPSGVAPYRFSGELSEIDDSHDLPPIIREDSDALVRRGDIYALTAIVALAREMEASYKDYEHAHHVANLYRILSTVGKIDYIKPHIALLCDAIERIHHRVLSTALLIGVNKNIICEQIESKDYEPIRELRPRDPNTLRFVEYDDPVVYGDIKPARSLGSFDSIISKPQNSCGG